MFVTETENPSVENPSNIREANVDEGRDSLCELLTAEVQVSIPALIQRSTVSEQAQSDADVLAEGAYRRPARRPLPPLPSAGAVGSTSTELFVQKQGFGPVTQTDVTCAENPDSVVSLT